MSVLLFVVAAVLVVIGFAVSNDIIVIIGWVVWAIGLVLLGARLLMARRARRFAERIQQGAQVGDQHAMRAWGLMFKISGDLIQAEEWLQRSAEAGNSDAMFDLGRLIEQERGLEAARPWFQRAADAGDEAAQYLFAEGGVYRRLDN